MKQLKMVRPASPLADFPLPAGYSIRTYRQGDEKTWVKICNGPLGEWTEQEFLDRMLGDPGVAAGESYFLIAPDGRIAGTATAQMRPDSDVGFLHMVGIDEEFRGKGLSKPMSAVPVRYSIEQGRDVVWLSTDEWRLPAIKTYLDLGFRPLLYAPDMHDRWIGVLKELKINSIEAVDESAAVVDVLKY